MIAALFVLALQGDEIPEWIERLGSDDIEIREDATRALREAGDPAIPALLLAAESPDAEVRWRVLGLLDEAAARAPGDSLRLDLDELIPVSDGAGRVTLSATNEGLSPMLLHRPSLRVLGLACCTADGPAFSWLEAGATLRMEMEGPVFQGPVTLRPVYLRSRDGSRAARPVKLFALQNADVTQVVMTLQDLFNTGTSRAPEALQFAYDVRTNAIIAEGDKDFLDIVEQVVVQLDAGPVKKQGYRFRGCRDAVDFARLLEDLLGQGPIKRK